MSEDDPLARLRMFPGSVAEQVIALTDLWKQRSKRTFVAMRERINELEDLGVKLEPVAFDNYFRRFNRESAPEAAVWALIRVMRDDSWLPREQQCPLAEALYLAALKNVSVVTYARIYRLFPGQEEEFKQLCPLGDLIVERAHLVQAGSGQDQTTVPQEVVHQSDRLAVGESNWSRCASGATPLWAAIRWDRGRNLLFRVTTVALAIWALLTSIGFSPR